MVLRPAAPFAQAAAPWTRPSLSIDLAALVENWRALGQGAEAGGVIKADGYGVGAAGRDAGA